MNPVDEFILDPAAKQTHKHHVPVRLKVLRCFVLEQSHS